MFPRPDLYADALHHQSTLLKQAEQARLAREARSTQRQTSLRSRAADAIYALAVALRELAGALGSERAKLA